MGLHRAVRRLTLAVVGAAAVATAGVVPLQPAPSDAGATTADACGTVTLKANGSPWRCTFVDHFAGRSLDTDRWLVGETWFSGFRTGSTCFKAGNVSVHDGRLRLVARDEGRLFTCASPTGSFTTRYTGGHVGTRGRFSQTYGKYVARARYPASGAGVGAGFWLYPSELTYGTWPASGEIDVAEWWSNVPNTVLPSLHYNGSDMTVDSGWDCTVATPTQFHTYGVVWTRHQMVFSIDDRECFRRAWTPTWPQVAPQPFDHPFELVLNMGVDKTTGPNAVTSATRLPAMYEVEYVKVWR